jgi:hypothetical protein
MKEKITNISTEDLETALRDYSNWLHKKGYIDADYYTEEPNAVDAYLQELTKKQPNN